MKQEYKDALSDAAWAALMTFRDHSINFVLNMLLGSATKVTAAQFGAGKYNSAARLWTARKLAVKDVDGRVVAGPAVMGYAKFASRKPFPGPGEKTMGIENEPHTVDDFSGKISSGYGAGVKKLIYGGNGIIKIKGGTPFVGKVNIHEHKANRAGLHYDFVAEGIPPGTKEFEINIPAGPFKGRYAFRQPEGFGPDQVLIIRMKDEDIVLPKPHTKLIDVPKLQELDESGDYIVEWKPDGGLANIHIKDDRAIFTSHREQAAPYYDKLPGIEWIKNNNRLWTNRLLFRNPDLDGTVLQGELFHPEGAARVGGILNSGADKAIQYQREHGPVKVYVWDIFKYKGKDVHSLPYEQRRALYESVVRDIRRNNKLWEAAPARTRDFVPFYNEVIRDERGLPYSEGLVVKHRTNSNEPWRKVKFRDTYDVKVIDILEGAGKREGKAGRLLVETPSGGRGEVGSFQATDSQLKWIWDNRDILRGQVAEIYAQEVTKAGAPRAGVFIRWHPSKSEAGLLMYSLDDRDRMYAMKSAAGWRPK